MRFIPDFVLKDGRRQRRNLHNLHDQQLCVNDLCLERARGVPIRTIPSENPLHYSVDAWNLLPQNLLDLPLELFRREIRKFELFSSLVERAPNVYTGRLPPPLAYFNNNIQLI